MDETRELNLNELDAVSGGTSGNTVLNSGSFQSETGTGLDIRVDWSVVENGVGEKTVEVQVSSLSFRLSCMEMDNGVELTVNGAVYMGKSAGVECTERGKFVSPLAGFSIPDLSGIVEASAVWHFNGSYSGTPLRDIRATGVFIV